MTDPKLTQELTSYCLGKEILPIPDSLSNIAEGRVLIRLLRRNGGILVGELQNDLGLSSGRVANLLKQLEEKELLLRIRQNDDRRRYSVVLTEEGKRKASLALRELEDSCERFLEDMGEEDGKEIVRLFGKALSVKRKRN